jgi:hypothetical protein
MPYYYINSQTNPINENQCIGDSLPIINSNYMNLDNSLAVLSSQHITLSGQYTTLKFQYNTLIRALSGAANPGTTYNSLSTVFRTLSSLVIP